MISRGKAHAAGASSNSCESVRGSLSTGPGWANLHVEVHPHWQDNSLQDWSGPSHSSSSFTGLCTVSLSQNIQRKQPELWFDGYWALHHDNAPNHKLHQHNCYSSYLTQKQCFVLFELSVRPFSQIHLEDTVSCNVSLSVSPTGWLKCRCEVLLWLQVALPASLTLFTGWAHIILSAVAVATGWAHSSFLIG